MALQDGAGVVQRFQCQPHAAGLGIFAMDSRVS